MPERKYVRVFRRYKVARASISTADPRSAEIYISDVYFAVGIGQAFARQGIGQLVLGMAGVAFYPMP